MSVPAQAGDFGFALQAAKIGEGNAFVPGSHIWYRHEAISVRIDLIQADQILPPEVSPTIVPKGAYKDQKYGAGQADLIPRLQKGFGALLYALMGDVSSVTGVTPDGDSVATVNTHIFKFDTSAYKIPWMACRRLIPGTTGNTYGDTIYDAKLTNMRITAGARGKIATRITVVGRDVHQEDAPTWTWDNDYENNASTPESGAGFIKIEGTEYPITAAVVEFDNGVSTPNQEMIIGQYTPDDFIPLYRTCTMRFVYKWEDPDLYQILRNGGSGSTTWTNLPEIFTTVGNVYALELAFQSPLKITGSTPYDLRIRGNSLVIGIDGPIELAGAQILQQAFTATLLDPQAGGQYVTFVLSNAQTPATYDFAYSI